MKDCNDYKKLTKYTDAEIVQLRLHMDQNLKWAIDVNYGNNWDNKTLTVALDDIKAIVQRTCNEAVYQKEFQGLMRREHETIAEYHVHI